MPVSASEQREDDHPVGAGEGLSSIADPAQGVLKRLIFRPFQDLVIGGQQAGTFFLLEEGLVDQPCIVQKALQVNERPFLQSLMVVFVINNHHTCDLLPCPYGKDRTVCQGERLCDLCRQPGLDLLFGEGQSGFVADHLAYRIGSIRQIEIELNLTDQTFEGR